MLSLTIGIKYTNKGDVDLEGQNLNMAPHSQIVNPFIFAL